MQSSGERTDLQSKISRADGPANFGLEFGPLESALRPTMAKKRPRSADPGSEGPLKAKNYVQELLCVRLLGPMGPADLPT
jgi:hypothetical protein